jgi:Holliday junction resolvase-like predicted endonuclease
MNFQPRHDGLVNRLEAQLLDTRDYQIIWKFFEYCRNGVNGEVDLLAMADELYDFYEVKSSYCRKSHNKAKEQFSRYKRAFPKQRVQGYLYCGEGLIRL